jgi:hypothetical protein
MTMKKLTIIANPNMSREVCVDGTVLPVGVELTVSDTVASLFIPAVECLVGYFVANDAAVSELPTTGISDGSYVFIMSTQSLKFLSGGAWV